MDPTPKRSGGVVEKAAQMGVLALMADSTHPWGHKGGDGRVDEW